jgi:5-formyltetrahydrofolate cyclo-ligase
MGKTELRRRLLNRRRRIPQGEARRAAAAASLGAWRLRAMARARRIAVYFPVSHELDCRPLMEQAWARGRELYLPVLHGKRLRFRRYEPGTRLLPNRFGIPEPDCQTELGPTAIDVAITPLVGFDRAGNRLGMGGGFYDRTFHFLHHRYRWRRPRLVGFAFEVQRVKSVDCQDWDVPLDAVVTESANYEFDHGKCVGNTLPGRRNR